MMAGTAVTIILRTAVIGGVVVIAPAFLVTGVTVGGILLHPTGGDAPDGTRPGVTNGSTLVGTSGAINTHTGNPPGGTTGNANVKTPENDTLLTSPDETSKEGPT